MYDAIDDLSPSLREDLADWLLCLADNKRLLGLRYAEWGTGAPELEADVSISAMSQYELGHARLLRGVLAGMEEDPRTEARDSDPAAWRCVAALDQPAPHWDALLALNGLVDNMLTTNLVAATNGELVPLAQRLRKAVSEEEYHSLHAAAWFERMQSAPAALRERFAAAVRRVYRDCLVWFGPSGNANNLDRLAAARVLDADAAGLRDRFVETVAALGVDAVDLDDAAFDGWDPASRRTSLPDFDEDSFAMLTGAHARAMGVSD